ncbi:hypothetical protein LMG27174_06645 [Paraburkholderia rhynchosiae]|uniref:Uncharacterized protein n=1 Tax=Paraburkholderia rhynchosiae TaxID=487049 RepID=A0A6J5CNG2_9BURK|nr:hypothetical protein LMG27174_06645 [Paraburkholderia rhynchosiae]
MPTPSATLFMALTCNDVGQYKATLLVNRLNLLMGTNWKAEPRRVDSKLNLYADMVIGCVDSSHSMSALRCRVTAALKSFCVAPAGRPLL